MKTLSNGATKTGESDYLVGCKQANSVHFHKNDSQALQIANDGSSSFHK